MKVQLLIEKILCGFDVLILLLNWQRIEGGSSVLVLTCSILNIFIVWIKNKKSEAHTTIFML